MLRYSALGLAVYRAGSREGKMDMKWERARMACRGQMELSGIDWNPH